MKKHREILVKRVNWPAPGSKYDPADATFFFFRVPILFACIILLGVPSVLLIHVLALVSGIATIFLPRKIMDIIGMILYGLVGLLMVVILVLH